MPRHDLLWKYGAHRVAGIALFRALLQQTRCVPVTKHELESLGNVIRNRFKAHRFELSPRKLYNGFEAGYQALELLSQAATGKVDKVSEIRDVLGAVPCHLTLPPKPYHPTKLRDVRHERSSMPLGPRRSILDRPTHTVSGVRNIPRLFTTQDIPFLRIKKPQPESLSRYIRGRKRQRIKRNQRVIDMGSQLDLCRYEDDWDFFIDKICAPDNSNESSVSWASAVHNTIHEVNGYIMAEKAKNKWWAHKLLNVVDNERRLVVEGSKRTRDVKAG